MWKFLVIMLVIAALQAADAVDKKKKGKKGGKKTDTSCDCLDICFNIDTSGSIDDTEWGQVLDFMCRFIGTFNNPPDNIRFCAIEFSREANSVFGFGDPCNTDPDYSDCKDNISAIVRQQRNTNHEEALKLAITTFQSDDNRPNDECPDIHILITDGRTNGGGDPIPVAEQLAANDVITLVVAIGDGVDRTVLDGIAGDPSRVLATDFDRLPGIVNALRTEVCDTNEFDPACQTCCCGEIFGDHHKPCPDRRNKCCGKYKWNPKKIQAVCCQGYWFAGYDERWTRCCYDKPYNIKHYTCCYNRIVPATRTQDQCCGFIAFNQKHEICCSGKVYKKDKHTQCCYDVAFNPKWEICCYYVVSEGCTYDYRCCGNRAYRPEHEICCDPYRSIVEDSPVKYCGQDIELPCGKGVYDPAWHICCCGWKYDGGVTRKDGCCRHLRYNVHTHLCCQGYLIEADPAWYHCCGRYAFDVWTHTCCHGYFLVEGVGQCCGYYKVFNHKHEICCGGYYVFKGKPHRTKCCYSYYYGYRAYDIKKELCCYGYVQRGGRHWYCCGYYSYNIKTHMCCYGRIYSRKLYRLIGFCDLMRVGNPGRGPFADLAADDAAGAEGEEPPNGSGPPPDLPASDADDAP